MKKISKNKWILLTGLIAVVLVVISSCQKDFLDRKPLGRFTEDDIPAGSFDGQVFAMYAMLRGSGFNNHLYLGIQNFRSDEAQKGSSGSDGANQALMYDDFEYIATNGGLQEYWTDHYKAINAANAIIDTINVSGTTDPATLVNKAEAKFIRAFCYFDLVRAFGQVPKIDFVGDAAALNIPKSTEAEIFNLIDADLTEAVAVLPISWQPTYIGRLTTGTAMALQAKTFLWRSNWGAALASAKGVINLGIYSLVPNYGSQFAKTGENGPESIMEIQAFYTPTVDQGIIYSNVQGVRGSGAWDLGWGWNVPTQKLVDEYETGDTRKGATILLSGVTDPLYGETLPPYPGTIPQPFWNKKVYTNPTDRSALNNRMGPWMNHRILRYGDVLMMAAEAANEVGGASNTTDALGWLEQIRARARGTSSTALPPVTTTDQGELRTAIRHERFVEMAMEEQRFWDIVRWGIDVDVLTAQGKNYKIKNRLLPLPQGEIDKSGGGVNLEP